MNIDFVERIILFFVLLLAQALVFNNIHLFNCATPLLYIYFVLHFPRNYPRWAVLIWCFAMGLGVDMFANTPGVAAASMTLVGMLQPSWFSIFIPRDSADDLVPSPRTVVATSFFYYVLLLVFLYSVVFFTLEAFNFFNWMQWLMNIGGSTVLTMCLIMAVENVRKS